MTHRSGTLLSASPPRIRPRLIEGRSKSSELCRANGSDSILRKTSSALQNGVVAEPGRRPVGGDAAHLQPQRQHPLGLDPDVQVGRLAGDREVADEAAVDQMVAAALDLLLGLLVADDPQPHPHPVLIAHRRRGRAASPPSRPSCRRRPARRADPPRPAARTALHAPEPRRYAHAAPPSAPPRPDFSLQHRQPPHLVMRSLDPPRLEPPFDEPSRFQHGIGLGVS